MALYNIHLTIDADDRKFPYKLMTIELSPGKMPEKISWQDIETVLLDMDGTLLDLHFDNHFWLHHVPFCYAEKHGLSHEEADKQIKGRYAEVRGTLDWYCVNFWTNELSLDIERLKHDTAEKISIRPEVVEFLTWLNANDKRVVLVTNAHPASLNLKMSKTKLDVHFDNIINAHDIGMAKEHEGFWEKLQQFEPYHRQHTMLIDDNLEVLESAHQYGIKYCYGISQPDSQGSAIESDHFTVINSFKDIMV
jgi:putative hydrolase of the HAD superfamily